ncbi:MAG: nucleotide exchange factor GrpE [Gemmatimonadaceae bacterium]|nr:nucleotide exchange factor GrpE [Gemmatimonadaceae bacterium]
MTDPTTSEPLDPTSAVDAPETQAQPQADGAAPDSGLAAELEASKDKYLRLAAEFENFRRRATKERQEAGWRAQGDLVRGLLDALDDITRFAHVDPTTVDAKTVVDGVAMVEKKLFKSLAGHGFEVVDPTGHPFNPNLHEAVTTAPAESAEQDGVVAVCFQAGYVINGHVLRPARVVVKQFTGN